MKSVITGIRATGIPHIGNYIGSIRPIMRLQEQYRIFQVVADLHAIPHVKSPAALRENVRRITACYLACGLDTERTVIWRQSHLGEMAWISSILSVLSNTQELNELTGAQFEGTGLDLISYMYPVLMAADTLMIGADYVFAGVDHMKGLQFIRQLAQKFNTTYGEILQLPDPLFPDVPEMIRGLDGRKMSKSLNNTISILEPEEGLYELIVNQAQTHSRMEEEAETLMSVLKYFVGEKEYEQLHSACRDGLKMHVLREELFSAINLELKPIRQRYAGFMNNPKEIDAILEKGLIQVKKYSGNRVLQIMNQVGLGVSEGSTSV